MCSRSRLDAPRKKQDLVTWRPLEMRTRIFRQWDASSAVSIVQLSRTIAEGAYPPQRVASIGGEGPRMESVSNGPYAARRRLGESTV